MTPLGERTLAERLRQTADSFMPPPGLSETIMASVSASKRQHDRSRSIALLAVAACVAAALVLGVSVLSTRVQSVPPADQITPSPSPSVSPSPDKPTKQEERQANRISYRWAQDLPRGADAEVVFAHEGTLYAGEQRVPLPPTVRVNGYVFEPSVSAVVRNGWVVSARDANDSSRSETGILSPDGTFTPFVHQYDGKTDRGCVALSPDQQTLVLGMDLVALPEGDQIGEIHPSSRYCQVWTDYGLIYPDRKNQMWIWDIGKRGRPQQLPDEARSIRSDGYGVRYEKGCNRIFRLQPNAQIETLTEMCGVEGSSLSPDAAQMLTDDYEVYDTTTQRLVQRLNVPDELRGHLDTPVWESADSVVFNLTNWAWYRQNGKILYDGFIVRCHIKTGECERASQQFSTRNGAPQVVMPLDASNPYWF
jgi:hypothetical protein